MSFELPALPYAKDALAPHISAETLGVSLWETPPDLRYQPEQYG